MSSNNKKVNGYVTLKSIVANVKLAKNDFKTKGFNRLLQLAIRGYKQLNLHGGLAYESEWVTLTDVNTIPLPSDFVKFVAVGIPFRGKLWTWTVENGLIEPHTESDGVEELSLENGETQTFGQPNYVAGYGVPGRNNVHVLIDEENRRITVNGFTGTKCLLYYQSTGISLSQDTFVPGIAEEALIAWVHWQEMKFMPGYNQYDKESARRDWENAYQTMIEAKSPTLDELFDAIYSGYMQAPKR